jgi:hypothetical protein
MILLLHNSHRSFLVPVKMQNGSSQEMKFSDDMLDLRSFCFDQPSSLNLGVAFFLMCGSTLSYIPQVKMYFRFSF